jgi:peptidyl-prolyl cis-trans isomerase C
MFVKFFTSVVLSVGCLLCSAVFAKQAEDKVLARFKNHQITETELSEFCKDMHGRKLQDLPVSAKKEILDIYLKTIVLEEAAKASKIEKTDEYKKRSQLFCKIFLIQAFVEKKIEERLTDNAIESAYKELIKNLKEKGELRLQYLFFASHEQAAQALSKIKSGKSFADVAKDLPKEHKSSKTLDTKYLRPYEMLAPQELTEKAFALNVNQCSDVISTNQGFYIVHVLEKREIRQMPSFAEMKYFITERLATQYREELEENLIKQADIKKFLD